MKVSQIIAVVTAATSMVLCGVFIPPAAVPDVSSEPAAETDAWTPLFDGRSLADWKVTDFGGQGEITVQDGCVFMDYGADLTGIHRDWPFATTNYEVELEAQRVEGQDFFVGMTFPVGDSPCTLILGGWGGGVCGLSSIDGMDAANNDTTTYRKFETGQWYHVRLRVTDEHIKAWVDGEIILWQETRDKEISVRFEVELSRPFGLCSYQTQTLTRNVRMRSYDPASKTETAKDQRAR